jgi:hypothetical protein
MKEQELKLRLNQWKWCKSNMNEPMGAAESEQDTVALKRAGLDRRKL